MSIAKSTSVADGGHLINDLQKDTIPPEELEKGAYDFVLDFRETDEMHAGEATGHLVESMVFTPDKIKKLATDPTSGDVDEVALDVMTKVLTGRWWVGFKVAPTSYAKVKSGDFKMFSIAGEADREDL